MKTQHAILTAALALVAAMSFSTQANASQTHARWPASEISNSKALASSSARLAPSKRDMIQRLKGAQSEYATELATLETAIRKQLQDSMSLEVAREEVRYASTKTGLLAKKIDELNKRRTELSARREIIDRLIFAIDSKYTNQPIQQFLEQQFLDMASTDLAEGRDSRMWKAYTYLSIAVREVPEPKEDLFSVIEGFMNFSSILDPKTPAEFLAARNYTNGKESVAANPLSAEEAGSIEMSGSRSGVAPLALELRMTMPKVQNVSAQTAVQPLDTPATVSGATQSASETN